MGHGGSMNSLGVVSGTRWEYELVGSSEWDHVAGQLRGDKECPFSGLTKSGRVWRKVPESDDRSVVSTFIHIVQN